MQKRYYNREIETMSQKELRDYQWALLKKQIEYTYAKSGLCQRQFGAAGITPDDIKTWAHFFNMVPLTTKEDMVADQELSPPYGTRLAVPESEIFTTFVTSGTSGKGQEVFADSRKDFEQRIGRFAMMHTWVGWDRGDRVMFPFPMSMTAAVPTHTTPLQHLGCQVFNLGMYDTKAKLQWMKRFRMRGIISNAGYLATLSATADEMGLVPNRDLDVRRIVVTIQAYPVAFVQKMKLKWHAQVFDMYGTSQGAGGGTCEKGAVVGEQRGHYHLMDHVCLHEVVNPDTLQPVAPGEFGEVIVTPLSREASPFLRFRTRDKVRYFPPEACDCERPFPLMEAGTISRYDSMMKIKGVNIWPENVEEVVLAKDEIAEYQGKLYISEDGKETAAIAIEFKGTVPAETRQTMLGRVQSELRAKTGIGFLVSESAAPLPRFEFKAKRWTDQRAKGL
ncbi:MAG: hypothetical protein HY670_12635 [Chloroflexi bacterium]|nr:hypothetical protein [Chloroflexota bacterium]